MRRTVQIGGSIIIFCAGAIWLGLDIYGRASTALEIVHSAPDWIKHLAAHQEWIYQFAPWALMAMGVISVALIQIPSSKFQFWRKETETKINGIKTTGPASLHDHYRNDFSNTLKVFNTLLMNSNDGKNSISIEWSVCSDFTANTKFISFYVPHNPRPYEACISLADQYVKILEYADKNVITIGKQAGDIESTQSANMPFSGRIYLYHFDDLSLKDLGFLSGAFEAKGLSLIPGGQSYASTKWLQDRAASAG